LKKASLFSAFEGSAFGAGAARYVAVAAGSYANHFEGAGVGSLGVVFAFAYGAAYAAVAVRAGAVIHRLASK
jgi:hypothetical protein